MFMWSLGPSCPIIKCQVTPQAAMEDLWPKLQNSRTVFGPTTHRRPRVSSSAYKQKGQEKAFVDQHQLGWKAKRASSLSWQA